MFVIQQLRLGDKLWNKKRQGDFAYGSRKDSKSPTCWFTSQGEGDVKVDVKTKFKDNNAFGIDDYYVMADIGFTCTRRLR